MLKIPFLQLSIIIVNYNVKYFLELCLFSVIKAAGRLDVEIFVVDNNSTDDSKTFFEGKFNAVKFIWNTKNVGFAKANNTALAMARGKYTLFLNPDTIVPEDCFIKCLSFFESQPDAGAIGVRMVDGSGRFLRESKRSFPSPVISLYKLSGLAGIFPKSTRFGRYHLGYLDENKDNEVDVLAGAFIMIKKTVADKLGGFDEGFFMYGEDIDLSYRIQQAGYKNFYFAQITIVHFKGESTKKGSLNYVRMFYKAMSVFVNKHYGSSKARAFNFLIQSAIMARAFLSAARRFIRWVGMPVIDAATILGSFWLTKFLWNRNIKQEVNYSLDLLIGAFLIFTLIFILASYFSGLYDNRYKQSKLNRSALAAIVLLLCGYSLLPESLRFSRGILVFGSIMAYALISLIRRVLVKFKVLESHDEEEYRQTIIAGAPAEYGMALRVVKHAGMEKRILGSVNTGKERGLKSIGNISELIYLFKIYPVKEVILCEGQLSFKEIITLVEKIPQQIRLKFFASNSESIIGSDSKDISGDYFHRHTTFKLDNQVEKRNKRLADLIISTIFIVTFPFHLVLQKKPARFFKNISAVLLRKKTWIGYASSSTGLPLLRPGIISVTSVPPFMNTMPEENLILADKWYAKHYTVWHDIELVWKSYQLLGV